MQPNETGRLIPLEPQQSAHHGAESHCAEFNERQTMRPDELTVGPHRSLSLNPRDKLGIVGTTCQAFSQTIIKPAGGQYVCQLCLPHTISVRIWNWSLAIGGHH